MPHASSHQNNGTVPQAFILPRSYLNYLCSQENDRFSSDFKNNLRLFPGIEIKERNEEKVKISINKEALPDYCKSTQAQAIILDALQTLESISKLPADVINPEAQKKMALSIHKPLENYLCLENSKSSASNPKNIAFLSFQLAITLALIIAYLILLSPLVIPSVMAIALSTFIVSSLAGMIALLIMRNVNELTNAVSIARQAKIACGKLGDVLEEKGIELDRLSPTKPATQEPQASSSAAANEPPSNMRSGSPKSSPVMFQSPAASASPVKQSDAEQESTATTACKP